jgi:crotonobetainyl-CoA:carnitine CoA-transferase CaiB-like acyl-CoA transferase
MSNKALAGLRVIEFGPYVALPLTGRILGSLGAEIIKVETNKVLDEMAFIPAWSRGAGQPDYQRGKLRVTIDVRTPEGREVLLELIAISDVFMTNFRRNVLSRWGIDFPEVREARPDIIVMWQTGLGGHGPYYTYKSYGILVQHMSGVSMMSGFPGEPPVTINSSYSDYHTGVFQPVAIIGALMRRALTGEPATLESSIFGSGAITSGPAILDYQANARGPQRTGNRDPAAVPHGVYPCQGEGTYCAVAVRTDQEWEAFCLAIDRPEWRENPEYRTLLDRARNQDKLDEQISGWTRQRSAEEVMETLQKAGVPASIVSQGQDLHDSPHLEARNFYRPTRYYEAERGTAASQWKEGDSIAWSMPVRMSETPMEFGHYSNIGEDNDYVFQEILGMPEGEVRRLEETGALY